MLQEARCLTLDLQYFPCINWFKDSFRLNQFCFYPLAPFRKSGFQNRMIIPSSSKVISLSIPLRGGRKIQASYNAVQIDHSQFWQRAHFRSIATAYGSAPFFFQYKDELKTLFERKEKFLYDWNLLCLDWLLSKIKIQLPMIEQAASETHTGVKEQLVDFYRPTNFNEKMNGPFTKYQQVFEDKIGFQPNMSILDLLFNVGPQISQKLIGD